MKFKIGQKVQCLINGNGIVENISNETDYYYPVYVKFDNGKIYTYSIEGKASILSNITLTTGTWKVEEILPEPEFQEGQPVWVRDADDQVWRLRYYSHKENKNHFVFCEQQKSGRPINYNFIKPFEGTDPNN
jgi:hypothetical protein